MRSNHSRSCRTKQVNGLRPENARCLDFMLQDWMIPADLSPGDVRKVLNATGRESNSTCVESAEDPGFDAAFGALWAEFGANSEVEQPTVLSRRLLWNGSPTGERLRPSLPPDAAQVGRQARRRSRSHSDRAGANRRGHRSSFSQFCRSGVAAYGSRRMVARPRRYRPAREVPCSPATSGRFAHHTCR